MVNKIIDAGFYESTTAGHSLFLILTPKMNRHTPGIIGFRLIDNTARELDGVSIADVIKTIEDDKRASSIVIRETPDSRVYVGDGTNEAIFKLPDGEEEYFGRLLDEVYRRSIDD